MWWDNIWLKAGKDVFCDEVFRDVPGFSQKLPDISVRVLYAGCLGECPLWLVPSTDSLKGSTSVPEHMAGTTTQSALPLSAFSGLVCFPRVRAGGQRNWGKKLEDMAKLKNLLLTLILQSSEPTPPLFVMINRTPDMTYKKKNFSNENTEQEAVLMLWQNLVIIGA